MSDGTDEHPQQPAAQWGDRRNLGERLFPGPSNPMSKQTAEQLERLLRSRAPRAGGARSKPTTGDRTRPAEPSPALTADDVTRIHEALDTQNDLLRAILSSSVDAQTDARSTAQNSRTFAWAGTAIALLTLVATVVLIVNGS